MNQRPLTSAGEPSSHPPSDKDSSPSTESSRQNTPSSEGDSPSPDYVSDDEDQTIEQDAPAVLTGPPLFRFSSEPAPSNRACRVEQTGVRQSDVSAVAARVKRAPVAYDVGNEQTPQHRFFTREFQDTLRKGIQVAKTTAETLVLSPIVQDNSWEYLLEEAKTLCTFQTTDTRTVALLGNSGEGKSSLINSLLHYPGIAKTGDTGSACTSVITEYRQKLPSHTAPICIEAEYLSQDEIEDALSELLYSYRQLHMPGVTSDETSREEYREYEQESAQAWSALEAAFKHHHGFSQHFLKDTTEGAFGRVKDQLIRWSYDIDWPAGGETGVWKGTAGTSHECLEQTDVFMGDKYWPFTKVIRIYLDTQILRTGVVLADLPGLQDTNLARVRATQDYMMRCNNVFVVANIARAITDQSLKSSLYSALSRNVPFEWEDSGAKAMNVAVVCTRIEDINMDRARQEFCGPGKRVDPSVIEQLERNIAEAKEAGDKARKKDLKKRREILFIQARNDHVKEGLRSAYARKVPGGRLDVFCVSNKWYETNSAKGNAHLVSVSGVPEIRRFCHQITADAQLREARYFIESSLFGLLNSLEMKFKGLSVEHEHRALSRELKETAQARLDETAQSAAEAIQKLARDFLCCFEEQISALLTQFNAWCRRNGDHATAGRPREDWNSQIIWKMRQEQEFQWSLVQDGVRDVFRDALQSIKRLLNDLKSSLTSLAPAEFRSLLEDGIASRINDLGFKINMAREGFARDISLTRRCATESNYTSYIVGQMLPTYRHASSQSGTGMAARQRRIVQDRITDDVLFPTIGALISDSVHSSLEQTKQALLGMVGHAMERLRADVDSAVGHEDLPRSQTSAAEHARRQGQIHDLLGKVEGLRADAERLSRSCRDRSEDGQTET
ncbi:dynamin family protein [Hirsutella rhossiliensis]|uniref:Dynamin family domain-containing protein n=1 Tax=Hirsutella rhossiliensis TaxID=111463 RepID=A0A9P8MZ41_9HYPO|nr:dynamin family domain-containing protein [Hirsutella rhossiliensis]KAH0962921.1 dynamin family domain-containing protein [Hirsutella rhossiliensis]